ncbi:esterase/lipase family protein [Komagataeibacter diospyri]|uniref:esterase/lipase family protein n=1 Tax=Komagataeibacter diospyri TaxID=1932662 RepID=UPI001142441C|nr:alpha/beta hydrolase [Komagataeibacter diospyri]
MTRTPTGARHAPARSTRRPVHTGHAARGGIVMALVLLAGCAGPVTVRHVSLVHSYRDSARTALQGGRPGDDTMIVLRRHGLLPAWRSDPDRAIATLRTQAKDHDDEADVLFALAELSYRQGLRHHHVQDFLAAAVYAYAFLQPGQADSPSPYDERFRQACDLYNLGLTAAFPAPVNITAQTRALPFGDIVLDADSAQLRWHGRLLERLQPTATLGVGGIPNVYRTPGLGEPLTALARPDPAFAPPPSAPSVPHDAKHLTQPSAVADLTGPAHDDALRAIATPAPHDGDTRTSGDPTGSGASTTGDGSFSVSDRLRLPASLLLEMDDPRAQALGTHLTGRLVLRVMDESPDTPIGHARVPAEYDQTAARALSLVDTALWTKEYRGFFDGTTYDGTRPRLIAMTPHRHGNMPVVFIHGTASSPYRWAIMVNDLLEDRRIRDHFDFWFFSYATSNPIPYSAWQLRHAITQAVDSLGGVKADPALGHITLVGHSQGGLLARMLVINPGDRLWDGTAGRPLSSFHLNDSTRDLVRETMFPTAMPEIQRVVFISTPQHGSYLAAMSIARLVGSMVSLPVRVTETARDIVTGAGDSTHLNNRVLRLGSVYAMSPRSAFMRTLPTIPMAPDVQANSIIPVCGNPRDLAHADDGVVTYESAHIPDVQSELVVRNSEHSTQSNPATIAEVQRILLLQLAQNPLRDMPPAAAPGTPRHTRRTVVARP